MDERREEGLDPLTGREPALRMRDIVSYDLLSRRVCDVRADLVSLLAREMALHFDGCDVADAAQHIAGNILAALEELGRDHVGR